MSPKQLIILAILIRLLIMPFFFHPDIKDISLRVSFWPTQQVTNIYEYLKQNPTTRQNAPDWSYPPFAYFVLGTYQYLPQLIFGPDFNQWLFNFSITNSSTPNIFSYLLILKLPYFIVDLLVGYLLWKSFTKPNQQRAALLFWGFNPLNLYAIYAIGQFDIIPASLTLLGYWLFNSSKPVSAGLALGLAACFKPYPLLLIPLFWLTKTNLWNKLLLSGLSVSIYGLTLLPFLNSPIFRSDYLFSNLSQRIFEFKLVGISIFPIGYLTLLIFNLRQRLSLASNITIVLLLIFALSRFHAQWIVWLTPFIALNLGQLVIKNWQLIPFYIGYFAIFVLFNDRYLTTGLLAPISPLFIEIPAISQLLSTTVQTTLVAISRGIFVFGSSILIWQLSRDK